jgi:hypothetical protein
MFGWATHYYTNGIGIIERLSFQAVDPSWVPENFTQRPIIGEHFFGDLQLLIAWGAHENPYSVLIPSQHLPIAQGILRLLSHLPMIIVFLIYLLASLASLWFSARALVAVVSQRQFGLNINDFLLFILLTVPVLVDLDRGNVNSIVISCCILFFTLNLDNRPNLGLFFLIIAICFKPYTAIFLLCTSVKNVSKQWISILLLFGLLNGLGFVLITGSLVGGFSNWLGAFLRYGSEAGVGYMANSGSLIGSISRWSEIVQGNENAIALLESNIPTIRVISLGCVLLGVAAWHQESASFPLRLAGALSIITVAQPGSAQYQWTWTGFVLLAALYNSRSQGTIERLNNRRVIALLYVIFILASMPSWIEYSSSDTKRYFPQYLLLSPLIVLSLIIFIALSTRDRWTNNAPHNLRAEHGNCNA